MCKKLCYYLDLQLVHFLHNSQRIFFNFDFPQKIVNFKSRSSCTWCILFSRRPLKSKYHRTDRLRYERNKKKKTRLIDSLI